MYNLTRTVFILYSLMSKCGIFYAISVVINNVETYSGDVTGNRIVGYKDIISESGLGRKRAFSLGYHSNEAHLQRWITTFMSAFTSP